MRNHGPGIQSAQICGTLNRALADEELQKRMRENCYKAAERYDLECIGQEWLALFGKL